jgi:hypothetical protein
MMALAPIITALAIFIVLAVIALIALSIWAFVFWILMIVDCTKRRFKHDADKIVWILVIIFTYIIGALIYYFVVKKK